MRIVNDLNDKPLGSLAVPWPCRTLVRRCLSGVYSLSPPACLLACLLFVFVVNRECVFTIYQVCSLFFAPVRSFDWGVCSLCWCCLVFVTCHSRCSIVQAWSAGRICAAYGPLDLAGCLSA